MDTFGHHALNCQTGGWLQVRHNDLVKTFDDIMKLAGLSSHTEVIITGVFGPNLQRADLQVYRYLVLLTPRRVYSMSLSLRNIFKG